MRVLCFDSETTGLPDWKQPSEAPHQPHLVQLAAILADETPEGWTEISSFYGLVKPEGWEIPQEMTDIHGISQERAMLLGMPERRVAAIFWHLFGVADLLVGHNVSFDARIMRIALKRVGLDDVALEPLKAGPKYDTCSKSTKLVNLPPTAKMIAAGFKTAKAPTLSEAYRHFFGEELAGAHDALNDLRANIRLYRHLVGLSGAAE